MADVTPSVFKIIQAYGGLKEAYFEVDSASSSDVIVFTDKDVQGIKMQNVRIADTGADVACTPTSSNGTLLDELTVGSGVSSKKLVGTILFRSY